MVRLFGKSQTYWKKAVEGYLFISPWIIGFAIFTAGALLGSFSISLTEWNIVGTPKFIGLQNYQKMLEDKFFWQSLKVTTLYLSNVPINLVLGLLLALLLNQKVRGLGFFRTIFYLPSVTAGVAVSLLWMWIFNPRFGIINILLKKLGITGPAWLGSETWALPALIIMSVWGVGGGMLIYLGALQSVPTALYEAATLDGAGAWRRFLHITIPMITPVLLLNLIMGIIGSFQVFTQAYIMTNGGPNYATLFYVLYLYQQAFRWFNMGYASALAWVLFLIILVCTYLVLRTSSHWVYYESE
ncbi:MAG: sugar ABC transporter permease [Anaerolineae bacterium]|nr:sugar ABC transporter permease [Anaerolineae bacterium]MDW8100515.1 sugar ABC transporter permease [Anaerolineae bacterium]